VDMRREVRACRHIYDVQLLAVQFTRSSRLQNKPYCNLLFFIFHNIFNGVHAGLSCRSRPAWCTHLGTLLIYKASRKRSTPMPLYLLDRAPC
jgi:hypothetical protein